MRKIGLLLIAIALLASACGGEPTAAPTALPPTATQVQQPAATPAPSAAKYIERGEAYVDQGELDKAAAEFQAAIRLDPANALAHNSLGVIYLNQNNLDEAERELREAVKLDHEYGRAHNNLGMVYALQGRYDDAIFELKEAIRIDKNDPMPYYNLGNCYKDMERPDEAIAAFQTYLQLEPDSPQKAAVEAEIAKLQGGAQTTLTGEYTDLFGGYSVRIPADWGASHDDLGVVALGEAGNPDPDAMFVIVVRPLSFYEHELGVDEITTLEQFSAAAGPGFQVDPQTFTSASVAGVPALASEQVESIVGKEMTGQMVLFVARGMGYAIVCAATPDAWAEFEPVGTTMLDSFTLVEPQVTAEYTSQAAGYSLRYPEGWVVTEEDTFVGLTPLADLQPDDAPYVALFAGQEQIVDAFNIEGELSTDNIIAGFVKATNAQSERLEPGTVGGQVGTAAEMAFEVDEVKVEGLLVIFEQAEPPLVVLLAAPASQGDSFAETFSQILSSLTFAKPAAASSVDQSDPAKVVQAVFDAAQTQSFTALAGLCDPQGENDKDTATICAMTAGHADKDSFVTYFAKGKINGEVTVSGDQAQVPFLFGPNGDQQETMSLIQRDGKWYLLEF